VQHRRSATPQIGGGLSASLGVGGGAHGRKSEFGCYGMRERVVLSKDKGMEKEVKEVKRGRWSPRFFGGGDGKEKEKEKERVVSTVALPVDCEREWECSLWYNGSWIRQEN